MSNPPTHWPLVTVITPLYNYAHFIGGCIESILQQTYPNIEMIVVDDGSTDNSAAVVQEYVQKYPQIHYIYQEKQKLGKWNMGVAPALNKALAAAQGEYIAWLSADDRATPERIAHSVACFEAQSKSNPKLAMVYSNVYLEVHEQACFDKVPLPAHDINTQYNQQGYVRWQSNYQDYGQGLLIELLNANTINGCTVLIKKSILQELGPFDLNYPLVHDHEMWLRMLLHGYQIGFIPEPLLISRLHTVNLPRWNDCRLESNDLARKIWETYPIETLYPPLKTNGSDIEYSIIYERLGDIFLNKRMFDIATSNYQQAYTRNPSLNLTKKKLKTKIYQAIYPIYKYLQSKLSAL